MDETAQPSGLAPDQHHEVVGGELEVLRAEVNSIRGSDSQLQESIGSGAHRAQHHELLAEQAITEASNLKFRAGLMEHEVAQEIQLHNQAIQSQSDQTVRTLQEQIAEERVAMKALKAQQDLLL